MKICPKCNVEKEKDQFYKNSAKRDKLDTCCKTCRNTLYNYNTKKFDSIKKSAKGYDLNLIALVAEELGIPFEKVKEVVFSQTKATKHAMNHGYSIKWKYVGKFHTKVSKVLTKEDLAKTNKNRVNDKTV